MHMWYNANILRNLRVLLHLRYYVGCLLRMDLDCARSRPRCNMRVSSCPENILQALLQLEHRPERTFGLRKRQDTTDFESERRKIWWNFAGWQWQMGHNTCSIGSYQSQYWHEYHHRGPGGPIECSQQLER